MLPKELKKGDKLTAVWLIRLVREVVARTVNAGPGLRATRTPAGTTLSLAAPNKAAATKAAATPPTRSGAAIVTVTATSQTPRVTAIPLDSQKSEAAYLTCFNMTNSFTAANLVAFKVDTLEILGD